MIIRQFLQWIDTVPAPVRAEATSALARAWLQSSLSGEDRAAALAALTWLLDDPAPEVRFALAGAFAGRPDAPVHIVMALLRDRPEIAAEIAGKSPLVAEADLIDLAAEGDFLIQRAIARRDGLTAPVAAALAEVAPGPVCAELLDNASAPLLIFSLSRLAERFAGEAELRNRLLARPDLPLTVRHRLLTALTDGLRDRAVVLAGSDPEATATYLEDARERATVILCGQAGEAGLPAFVEHLRVSGQLTARLLIRAAGQGSLRLFAVSLSVLTGQDREKTRHVLASGREAALRALLLSAGLPQRALGVLLPAVLGYRMADEDFDRDAPASIVRGVLEQVAAGLAGDERARSTVGDDLVHFIRGLAIEAARNEARRFVEDARTAA